MVVAVLERGFNHDRNVFVDIARQQHGIVPSAVVDSQHCLWEHLSERPER